MFFNYSIEAPPTSFTIAFVFEVKEIG